MVMHCADVIMRMEARRDYDEATENPGLTGRFWRSPPQSLQFSDDGEVEYGE
jgi:hypothetical protein